MLLPWIGLEPSKGYNSRILTYEEELDKEMRKSETELTDDDIIGWL